ncbi:MAG TPA: hypothetical protein V6D08_11505 [Candidatus Obscuribacterales bacterium]
MTLLLALLALAAAYPVAMGVRWMRARSLARAAIDNLQVEILRAQRGEGEQYSLRFQNPELMFQVLEEVKETLLALEGSMILMTFPSWRQRLCWGATSGYQDVIDRAERGMRALSEAAFFAQFPPGVPMFRNVRINGIPLQER